MTTIESFLSPGDKYSDVNIVFRDQRGEVEVESHRILLAWKIPYFDKLFSFSDNRRKKEFVVHVEEASVASLFIRVSLYEEKINWTEAQKLHLFLLKSFFCLEVPVVEIEKISLTPDNFELFLRVVNLPEVELNANLLGKIRKNIPPGYDWRGISEEFKQMVTNQMQSRMVVQHANDSVGVWDLVSGEKKIVYRYKGKYNCIYWSICSTKNPNMVMLSSYDAVFSLDINSGELTHVFQGKSHFRGAIILVDERTISVRCKDCTDEEWDIVSDVKLRTVKKDRPGVRLAILTADKKRAVTVYGEDEIRLLDTTTEEYLRSYGKHWGVGNVIITPDDKYIITSGEKSTIKMWNLESGEFIRKFRGHTHEVDFVLLMGDNKHIISSSVDRTVKIWNIFTGECVRTYEENEQFAPMLGVLLDD